NLRAELGYSPEAPRPWTYTLHGHLTAGRLRHAKVPLALADLAIDFHLGDGHLKLEKLTARSGQAKVRVSGEAQALRPDTDFKGLLTIEHLPISSHLFDYLPPNVQKIKGEYSPSGPVTLTLKCQRTADRWVRHCTIQPEDLTATFFKFPYPLEH